MAKKTPAAKTPTNNNKNKSTTSTATPSTKLKPATSISTRHILCSKHSTREAALEKLRAGAKFDDVAREFSEDKARQGGNLGWKTRGSLDAEFEKVAYGLEVSTTGNPKWGEVKSEFGYHVVMVEGRR